jgi:hypothetical protein
MIHIPDLSGYPTVQDLGQTLLQSSKETEFVSKLYLKHFAYSQQFQKANFDANILPPTNVKQRRISEVF